jgi:cystathionine beta-synthase
MTRDLVRLEGLFVGGSSGAVVAGAIKYAEQLTRPLKILMLLPDSAQKYLSKIFNDNWMRENGFLADEPGLGTIRELLAGKSSNVVTARASMNVRDAIATLKSLGISQLPVVEAGRLVGLVHEVDLLRHLVSGQGTLDSTIEGLIESDYATVTPDTKIELLQGVLSEAKIALVLESGNLQGIVTKIDLIEYLATRAPAMNRRPSGRPVAHDDRG